MLSPNDGPWIEPLASLNRSLSWDPYGIYALDADKPLTPASRQIVENLKDAELGRAESLARYRLKIDPNDLVPAWALAQIVRVRKQGLIAYRSEMENKVDQHDSLPTLLYRFHLCRLAILDVRDDQRPAMQTLYQNLRRRSVVLRDLLRASAGSYLGVAVAISQSNAGWADINRSVLGSYVRSHPKGPDVRPLLCRADLDGMIYLKDGKVIRDSSLPNVPDAKDGYALAQAILKDRPEDPLGLFYSGRAQFMLGRSDAAILDIRKALQTNRLPSAFEKTARNFLSSPSERAFRSVHVVD